MLQEWIEAKWVLAFEKMFALCDRGQGNPVAIRSTGATDVVPQLAPAIQALGNSTRFVDCTAGSMPRAPGLPNILKMGTRGMMISDSHPEALGQLGRESLFEPGEM